MGSLQLISAEHAKALLAPITLACKTKVAKIVGIGIAALQRLVALGDVPTVGIAARRRTDAGSELFTGAAHYA